MKKNFLCLVFLLFGMKCGVVDTTDTGITARIYNPDGTPAASATVSLFQASDTSRTPVEVMTTDNNGSYALPPTKAGTYNIWAEKGGLVAFQDSVYLSSSIKKVSNDTLGAPGSITAIVGMQPNHDPRTVTVQVLGTYKYSNVLLGGRFTMDGMAAGNYTLRLVSTLPGYTPTYQGISVNAGKDETLKDTIMLIYTGIPVVTGLKATYDTVSGSVNLQWNKTTYWDFQDYLIYRDPYDSVTLSTKPIAWRIDTTFSDTVFQNHLYPADDTNNYHLKYRVAVRNNAMEQGITYRFADVLAVSPAVKKMRFDFTGSTFDSSEIRPGDTLLVIGKFTSPINTTIASVSWKDMQKGSIIASKTFAVQQRVVYDTLRYRPALSGACTIVCTVTDSKSVPWNDTVYYRFADSKLPSDSSVFHRVYTIGRGDTAVINTPTRMAAYFKYRLNPPLKSATWTDLDKNSVIAIDSLYGYGPWMYGGNYLDTITYSDSIIYTDSVSYSWSSTGTKKIGCTIADEWGRTITDTIQVHVVAERLDVSISRMYYMKVGAFYDSLQKNYPGVSSYYSIPTNDTAAFSARFWNPLGFAISLVSAQWTDLVTNAVLAQHSFMATGYSYADTLKYAWSSPGIKNIGCTITDSSGSFLTDTLRVTVVDSLK